MAQTTMWTQRRLKIGFLLVLAVVLTNAWVAYQAQQRLIQVSLQAAQTHEKILGTAELLEALLNVETGQRGYLITLSDAYLAPYQEGRLTVTPRLRKLSPLLADDAENQASYEELVPLVQQKLEELEATIQLARTGRVAEAQDAVLSHQGKNLMDQIRSLLMRIHTRQYDVRVQRMAERDALAQRVTLTLFIGTLLTVLALSLAYALNRRELETYAQGQAALAEANAQLEARVTERTEQLNQANQELTRSNRELQDFAFVASHDLQEPLRKIQAFGDLLKQDYGEALGNEGRDFIGRMQNASQRMELLIKDLLAYSRITTRAQPFAPVDLNEIAREVLNDLETRLKQTGGQVAIADLPTIEADALQMRQLLQNLIGNALKFNRPGVPPRITVGSETDATICRIFVSDNGIGFEEKYLDRIFTPFQRLHRLNEYEGTGMGLAVCQKVVERHGGTLTAKSEPGVGSTFVFTLPLVQQKEPQSHE